MMFTCLRTSWTVEAAKVVWLCCSISNLCSIRSVQNALVWMRSSQYSCRIICGRLLYKSLPYISYTDLIFFVYWLSCFFVRIPVSIRLTTVLFFWHFYISFKIWNTNLIKLQTMIGSGIFFTAFDLTENNSRGTENFEILHSSHTIEKLSQKAFNNALTCESCSRFTGWLGPNHLGEMFLLHWGHWWSNASKPLFHGFFWKNV